MRQEHGIFHDLLNVEVNTIVRHSMTAEKMPALPFALLDIIQHYGTALAEMGVDLEPYFAPSRADCWAKISADATCLAAAQAAYEATHGPGQAPTDQAALFNYVTDLWPLFPDAAPQRASEPKTFEMLRITNGWDSFERLRVAAHGVDPQLSEGYDKVTVARIIGSCSRLKYIVQGLEQDGAHPKPPKRGFFGQQKQTSGELAALAELIPKTRNQLLEGGLRKKQVPTLLVSEQFVTVRKAWEVGVERVVVQTTVHIDGDVVTRISAELLDKSMLARRDAVLGAHQRSLDVGLTHWRSLVDIAIELVTKVVGKLTVDR